MTATALVVPGVPETDVLEMRYSTTDCGYAEKPFLEPVADCVKRIRNHILRTPGNWAVFTSRSDVMVQVSCSDGEEPLWLETPYPERELSLGRHVTLDESARVLTVLAREDRSMVPDLDNLETVTWD